MSVDEERRKWLEGLKVGDEIASACYSSDTVPYSAKRVTVRFADETSIVIGDGFYCRQSGQWHGTLQPRLEPLTESIIEVIDRTTLRDAFEKYWELSKDLPITKVRKLLAVLEETEQPDAAQAIRDKGYTLRYTVSATGTYNGASAEGKTVEEAVKKLGEKLERMKGKQNETSQ